MMHTDTPRGFTLLIAVVLSSVIVSVGLALLDVTLKQVLLSSAAVQSQYAFYNADTTLECALYWDQRFSAFDYTSPAASNTITCANMAVTNYVASTPTAGTHRIEFSVPCATPGTRGYVTIDKTSTGITLIYANGYNSCDASNPRRTERGLKAQYGP